MSGSTVFITATADAENASLPIGIALCQTNPSLGQYISAIGPTVTTQMNASATAMFAIFVMATGPVPFDPAGNRVFARFKDATGAIRGSTSVAARTE